jgi:hypothetical protein
MLVFAEISPLAEHQSNLMCFFDAPKRKRKGRPGGAALTFRDF